MISSMPAISEPFHNANENSANLFRRFHKATGRWPWDFVPDIPWQDRLMSDRALATDCSSEVQVPPEFDALLCTGSSPRNTENQNVEGKNLHNSGSKSDQVSSLVYMADRT